MLDFWRSFASTFKSNRGLIFDPVTEAAIADWNDPHPDPAGQWACWLHGCTLDSVYDGAPRFAAAGLQSIVDTIRQTGAKQPIVLGGIDYNADLTQLLTHLPTDPAHQLVASFHVYDFVQGKDVDATFRDQLAPIAKRLPVVLGELGERNCNSGRRCLHEARPRADRRSAAEGQPRRRVRVGLERRRRLALPDRAVRRGRPAPDPGLRRHTDRHGPRLPHLARN